MDDGGGEGRAVASWERKGILPEQPHALPQENHSSYALTLVLPEIKIRAINIDNSKWKKWDGLGLAQCM